MYLAVTSSTSYYDAPDLLFLRLPHQQGSGISTPLGISLAMFLGSPKLGQVEQK